MNSVGAQGESVETRRSLFDMSRESLVEWLRAQQAPAYRATQILDWAYRRGAAEFEHMSDVPKVLRVRMATDFRLFESRIITDQCATDGTRKLLLQWIDGETTECVLIPDGARRTACISTQVGCPVGCVFCASGLGGLTRHLSAGQIVEQAVRINALSDTRLTNVVFMGLGEPLHNLDATISAVQTINADWGLGIGARRITISTVGLPKQIEQLASHALQCTLAISLHAPNDALRRDIIPWAKSVTIDDLVRAAKCYFERTGREVTIEYVLLADVNDRPSHARELAAVCKLMRCNVNLIRFNPVADLPYQRPTAESAMAFSRILREKGIRCHTRRSRGLDIDGACGQLRKRHMDGPLHQTTVSPTSGRDSP